MRKAREYIGSHLYGAVRIPEIAAALSISEGHLSRVFRAAMHVSIIDYVNRMKVNVMAEIMQTQRITLAKAAETMGIGDPLLCQPPVCALHGDSRIALPQTKRQDRPLSGNGRKTRLAENKSADLTGGLQSNIQY